MAYTAISIKGGRIIVKAVQRLALQRELESGKKQTVGELVYDAMLNTYGKDLHDAISFFEESDDLNHQSLSELCKEEKI